MSWEWSHSEEGTKNVEFNIGLIPHDELVVIWAENKTETWLYDKGNERFPEYEAWREKAKQKTQEQLAIEVFGFAENIATCDNGGFNAYLCPDGCHTVPFDVHLDEFTEAFCVALFWSETYETKDRDDNPFDGKYSAKDLGDDCLRQIAEECKRFQTDNLSMIAANLNRAGHDFCLTRNCHGAGFWDGDWPKWGDKLTKACRFFSTCHLILNEYGKPIYWAES